MYQFNSLARAVAFECSEGEPITGLEQWRRIMITAAGIVLLTMLSLTGQNGAQAAETAPERTVTHDLGSTVIAGKPHTVVALEFSFVEALHALGVNPVGIADDNQPKRIEQLLGEKIEFKSVGTRLEPNLEIVSSLAPDLIIADRERHSGIYPMLGSIAPTIVLNSWEGGYQDIKNSIVTIAEALGSKEAGEKVVKAHEAVIADLKKKIPAGEQRRFLMAVVTPDVVALHTSTSFSGSVFSVLGLQPALVADKPVEGGVGLERLASINPDVLFVATDGERTLLDQWKTNAVWLNISAVKNNRVFAVDRNQYTRFRGLRTAEIIANDVVDHLYSGK